MLVGQPVQQPYFYPQSSSATAFELPGDINDFFDFPAATNSPAGPSNSSRSSSPQSPFSAILATPPQDAPVTSFPDIQDFSFGASGSSSFNFMTPGDSLFSFLEEDNKLVDPMLTSGSMAPYDLFSGLGVDNASVSSMDMTLANLLGTSSSASPESSDTSSQVMSIDPQLVATPASSQALSEFGGEDAAANMAAEAPAAPPKLTLTIQPVKVAGHGKGRKGTVQSGGIAKKTATPVAPALPTNSLLFSGTAPLASAATDKENLLAKNRSTSAALKNDIDEDDDDLPEDWRPPPEVFAKMTSKEKRQLRNKISARNFRVRRKEYITTLEMDVAERDRLLQTIRTELGSSQSENVALRQEIASLKKALLEGRSGALTSSDIPQLNLPPPAPLPAFSAAATTPPAVSMSQLLTPNTHKDMPSTSNSSSPRMGAFWGGVGGLGLGGGITPVHTVLMPELSSLARNVNRGGASANDNINPALNSPPFGGVGNFNGFNRPSPPINGFDGFSDLNPFTMKSIDAYRMQLWTRMASQQQPQFQSPPQPPYQSFQSPSPPPLISSPSPFTTQPLPPSPPYYNQHLSGLASSLKPAFFQQSTRQNVPISSPSLTALLSGKHSSPSTPPLGGSIGRKDSLPKSTVSLPSMSDKEQLMLAALAHQTLFQKLSGAFWTAFAGGQDSKNWDADKVRKVLEGKAVLKIVDVEPTQAKTPVPSRVPSRVPSPAASRASEYCSMGVDVSALFEGLTISKKS